MRASLTNLTATATITASSADGAYPANNIKTPEQPDNPAKTTVTTDSWWTIDHGSAKSVPAWALIYCNFTSVKIQANATDAWGAPSYDSGTLTVGVDPLNGRYCLFHRPGSAQNFRYNRVFVPAQTPTPSTDTVFRLGGVWTCSALVSSPRDFRWDFDDEEIEPVEDVFTLSERRQRLYLGERMGRIAGKIQGATSVTAPMVSDELSSWQDYERQWKNADIALISFSDTNANWVGVLRDLTAMKWRVSAGLSERDFEWEEVAG